MSSAAHFDLTTGFDWWMANDHHEETRQEILSLKDAGNTAELEKRLNPKMRMEFGTAGLRGRMGAGLNMMNDLVVLQTTLGLHAYLEKLYGASTVRERGIVIGYDGRFNSERYAKRVASVFLRHSVRTYLFSTLVPTPFVAYSTRRFRTLAGVMITASHNPKADNGYKLYAANGAQIRPPVDLHISSHINAVSIIPKEFWQLSEIFAAGSSHLIDPLDIVQKDYYAAQSSALVCSSSSFTDGKKVSFSDLLAKARSRPNNRLSFVYTPLHGVGWQYARKMVETLVDESTEPIDNWFVAVPEQAEPDGDFPTVVFPNPEEGAGTLKLSLSLADARDAPIVVANDPDADRLCIAEKSSSTGWRIVSGNEFGILLGWFVWDVLRLQVEAVRGTSNGDWKRNVYMLASAVSSGMLGAIAEAEGFSFEPTLTGFKWMGNRAIELAFPENSQDSVAYDGASAADELPFVAHHPGEKLTAADYFDKKRCCVFAFEEAIGYEVGSVVFDKDGIGALRFMLQLAAHVYAHGSTLCATIDSLYDRYGYHKSLNSYFICYDQPTIRRMFDRLRDYESSDSVPATRKFEAEVGGRKCRYPTHCGRFVTLSVRDLTLGYDSDGPDGKPTLPIVDSGQMITFRFRSVLTSNATADVPIEDDAYEIVITIRTSGTEPKIKYYSEICETRGQTRYTRAQLDAAITELVDHAVAEFYEPEKNGLIWRK